MLRHHGIAREHRRHMRAALRDALYAAPWATLGTALWILIAYKFHQSMIDAVTGGREVTRQEEPRLYNLLENLCISRGITMPKLKIIEDDSLNAFATGMGLRKSSADLGASSRAKSLVLKAGAIANTLIGV